MTDKQKITHDYNLDKVCDNVHCVGESKHGLDYIIRDGSWFFEDKDSKHKLCDIILVYQNYAIPIEVKRSKKTSRHKAYEQIESGYDFIVNHTGLSVPYGKIYYYHDNTIEKHYFDTNQLDLFDWR